MGVRLPFVSRERLEEEQARVRALEAERRQLLDRLALLRGEPPLFAEVPAPAPRQEAALPEEAPEPKKIVAGSVTADHILREAAKAVREHRTGLQFVRTR